MGIVNSALQVDEIHCCSDGCKEFIPIENKESTLCIKCKVQRSCQKCIYKRYSRKYCNDCYIRKGFLAISNIHKLMNIEHMNKRIC